ncbi:MAG: leucine-rich repeat protein [Muribaculaceae bacterium]|nr:leucine-rich repeat protein [Muribaculaceae bacterium]
MKQFIKTSILLLAILLPALATAHDFEVAGIYYNRLSSDEVEVTYRGRSPYNLNSDYSGTVNIPATVTYNGTTYSVTSISDMAFEHCSELTNIDIPNSVTKIGMYAFNSCASLTAITIPNSVTSIGIGVFNDCNSLASISVAGDNPKYDSRNNCNAIIETATNTLVDGCKNTMIPNSVTEIGEAAFYECNSLTTINIPNSVTTIGTWAFGHCPSLTSIDIPNSVTSIGDYAFSSCSGLANISIPNSVTSIGGDAFSFTAWYNNQPAGLVYAGLVAYKYKGTMTEDAMITLKEGTTGIAGEAFMGCSRLTAINIPNSVTSIGDDAFRSCISLASITVASDNPKYDSRNNCNAIIETATNTLIGGCKNTIIPNSVASIGDNAFAGCNGLTSIVIPNSVTEIGHNAFDGCTGLTGIVVESGNPRYDSRNNCNAIIETADNTLIFGCKNTIIPNTVTAIGGHAFEDCTGLTSIAIPNSVTSIGYGAFQGCKGLTSIVIPNSVTYIEDYTFYGCTGLTRIVIPNTVTAIGQQAFYNTAWFNKQPGGLVYAGMVAYSYKGMMPSGTRIALKEGTLGIADYAFQDCRGLTSIVIPNSVTSIGYGAFFDCTGLTSIAIPNSVTAIDQAAFFDCTGLTSIIIPESVTSIGSEAFSGCTRLTDVYCFIADLSGVSSRNHLFHLDNGDYSGRTLHVLQGTADAYRADVRWYWYFGQIVEDLKPDVPGDINGDRGVNIADVNAIINIILSGNGNNAAADVNGDGAINIADVNAIIDIILSGAWN